MAQNRKIELTVVTKKNGDEKEYLKKEYFDESFLHAVNIRDMSDGERTTPNRCCLYKHESKEIKVIALSKEDLIQKLQDKGITELVKV